MGLALGFIEALREGPVDFVLEDGSTATITLDDVLVFPIVPSGFVWITDDKSFPWGAKSVKG